LEDLENLPATRDFYSLLEKLRTAALTQTPSWASYLTFQDYAHICFWAIRKHEYSFIAEAFSTIQAEANAPLRVLDVGSGVVPMCNWISQLGHDVIAFDPIREDVEFLVKNDLNTFYDSQVKYYVGRSEHLPFPDATFDVVTCVSVLEHMTPGSDLLSLWEIARVLKPNGHLLMTFDVVPPEPRDPAEKPSDLYRQVAEPFTMRTASYLTTQLANVFEVSEADLPAELKFLTWDEVATLWSAVQQHDERQEPVRYYLAMGSILRRKPAVKPLEQERLILAYVHGELALEKRARFYEFHATERLKQLTKLVRGIRK